jgi:hypothetical protein
LCPVLSRYTYPSANLGGESEKRPGQIVFQSSPTEGVRAFCKVAESHPLLCFLLYPFLREKSNGDKAL